MVDAVLNVLGLEVYAASSFVLLADGIVLAIGAVHVVEAHVRLLLLQRLQAPTQSDLVFENLDSIVDGSSSSIGCSSRSYFRFLRNPTTSLCFAKSRRRRRRCFLTGRGHAVVEEVVGESRKFSRKKDDGKPNCDPTNMVEKESKHSREF